VSGADFLTMMVSDAVVTEVTEHGSVSCLHERRRPGQAANATIHSPSRHGEGQDSGRGMSAQSAGDVYGGFAGSAQRSAPALAEIVARLTAQLGSFPYTGAVR
jgi:hypothetical protein